MMMITRINMRGCNSEGNPTNYALGLKVFKIKERYYFTCILEYVGVKKVGSLLSLIFHQALATYVFTLSYFSFLP